MYKVYIMMAEIIIIFVLQGVFSGCVGAGDQLGLTWSRTDCLLGECLHGNTTPHRGRTVLY